MALTAASSQSDRPPHWTRIIIILLFVALALRLAASATRPLNEISDDGRYYLRLSKITAYRDLPLLTRTKAMTGETIYITSIGPVYPAFLVPFIDVFPKYRTAQIGIRIAQSVIDTVSVFLVYAIGARLFNRRVGLVAAAALALDLRFILQAPDPSSETLYTAFWLAGLFLYLVAVDSEGMWGFVWAGAVLGVAALTRPVPILLPLALSIHALLAKEDRRRLLKGVGLMALALWAVVTPWMVRNAIVTGGEIIPVSDAAASAFWAGSSDEGRYQGHYEFYESRTDEIGEIDYDSQSTEYVQAGLQNILARPLTYVLNRGSNTIQAYLQPYGTVWFPGESIKELTITWMRGEATLADVVSTSGFWPKLVIYVFHFGSVALGLAGLILASSYWRKVLPLALALAYGTAVYAVLLIIPRYLFPLMPLYWVAAGYAIIRLWTRLSQRHVVRQRTALASSLESQ